MTHQPGCPCSAPPPEDAERIPSVRQKLRRVLRDKLLSEITGSIRGVRDIYIGESAIRIDVITDALLVELDLGIPCSQTGCRMRQIARAAAKKNDEM